jgi:hypothetical protein
MARGAIDHIVVGASDLETGSAWVEARLGRMASGGGAHPLMGTHNALWRLGPCYIEVIAVDPSAPSPGRPRWFGLDDPEVVARLADGPRLLTWVARPAQPIAEAAALSPVAVGPVERHHRGDLHWFLTVPSDGHPPLGGAMPGLIEWPDGVAPPPERLPENDLRLARLTLPASEPLAAALAALGLDHLVTLDPDAAGPEAVIATGSGPVILD